MSFTARMAALHSALWDIDRWYRVAWYAWPAALAVLISGWICVDKPGSTSSSATNAWGKPIAPAPNPVHQSPLFANWPAKLQNDVTTCFTVAAGETPPQAQLDACTHLVDSLEINELQTVNAYNQRGFLQRLSQPDRALADYEFALKFNPNAPAVLANRAFIYLARNRNDDAMTDLNKAIALLAPAEAGFARYLRGVGYFKQKKYDLAMEDLNESIKRFPIDPDPYLTRGEIEQAQQQWDAALRDFDEFSKRAPRNTRGLILKSAVLEATGRTAAALIALDTAIAIEPGNQPALTARDRLRGKQDDAPQPKPDGG